MTEKGFCQKHGIEFILIEGCPQCLAEKQGKHLQGDPLILPGKPAEIGVWFRMRSISGTSARFSKEKALVPLPGEDVEVQTIVRQSKKLLEYAEAREIKSLDDVKAATNDLSIIARYKKAMEEKRKEYVKPLQEQVKLLNDNYKTWMAPIEAADRITREKILAFNKEQEHIRREQEEINRKRMEAAEQEARLKNGEISESVNLVEVSAPPPKKVSTDMGTAGMVDNWQYEITDFAQLPDEYKVPDTAMLTRIAKKHHDQKQIPGVRFYNEPTLRVNTK